MDPARGARARREIPRQGGHADVYMRAARDQVFVDLVRRRHHVVWHITQPR